MGCVKVLASVIPYGEVWGKEGDAGLDVDVLYGIPGLAYNKETIGGNGPVGRCSHFFRICLISF